MASKATLHTLTVGAVLVTLMATATASHALSNCKIRVSKTDGTLSFTAKGVTGPLMWGHTEGTMDNAFFDGATCVDVSGNARGCEMGDVGTTARISPPPLCTLYVTDGDHDCRVYIAGCVPGNRVTCLSQSGNNAIFEGCNVHVRDESGDTGGTPDGLGNLIVGWNENPIGYPQTGSNNLIVGNNQKFTSYGGLVAGAYNEITDKFASVTGGANNQANGAYASVSGGLSNYSYGSYTSISGGQSNTAYGFATSVAGGGGNAAKGNSTFIGGGAGNTTNAENSAILGGYSNSTFGPNGGSAILGGSGNEVRGAASTVSGGSFNETTGYLSSIAGGTQNETIGDHSSIAGGKLNITNGNESAISGGLSRTTAGLNDWQAGSLFEDQ